MGPCCSAGFSQFWGAGAALRLRGAGCLLRGVGSREPGLLQCSPHALEHRLQSWGSGRAALRHVWSPGSRNWTWSRSVLSQSLWPHGLQSAGLLRPWDSPGKSTWRAAIHSPSRRRNRDYVACVGRWTFYTEPPEKPSRRFVLDLFLFLCLSRISLLSNSMDAKSFR